MKKATYEVTKKSEKVGTFLTVSTTVYDASLCGKLSLRKCLCFENLFHCSVLLTGKI